MILAILLAGCGWAAFEALAAIFRPARRPLLHAPRPDYDGRHRSTIQIGA